MKYIALLLLLCAGCTTKQVTYIIVFSDNKIICNDTIQQEPEWYNNDYILLDANFDSVETFRQNSFSYTKGDTTIEISDNGSFRKQWKSNNQ